MSRAACAHLKIFQGKPLIKFVFSWPLVKSLLCQLFLSYVPSQILDANKSVLHASESASNATFSENSCAYWPIEYYCPPTPQIYLNFPHLKISSIIFFVFLYVAGITSSSNFIHNFVFWRNDRRYFSKQIKNRKQRNIEEKY